MEGKTIVTSEKLQSDSVPLGSASRSICPVCQKQFSQYTCPRCNMRYCSLHCYKSHNSRCSESFMRENVEDELRQVQPDEESKRRMLDILKKFHSEEEEVSSDEDVAEGGLSIDTLQKVMSGVQLNYDDLSVEEKKLFQRAMASGELSKMIKPWEPWWHIPAAHMISLGRDGTQLVKPISNKEETPAAMSVLEEPTHSDCFIEFKNEIPPGAEAPLHPIRKLSSTEPSPLLAIHLVDVLYSYCFTLRLYNGDWKSDPVGASTTVLSMSSVLGSHAGGGSGPETVVDAVSRCLEQTCSPEFKHIGGLRFGFCLLDDVVSLISLGGKALICALGDLERMFQAGEKEMKLKKRKGGEAGKMKLAKKKIYFMMCWVNEQMEEVWSSLGALVKAEKASVLEYHGSSKSRGVPLLAESKSASSKNSGLIEEMQ